MDKNNTGSQNHSNTRKQAKPMRQRKTQKTLKADEGKYSSMVEYATDGMAIIQDEVIKFANQRMADMSGYTVEELTGMSTYDLVPHDFVPVLAKRYAEREQNLPVPEIFNTRLLCKDGTIKEMENASRPIQYEDQPAIISIVRDITGRKRIEEKLWLEEQRFRTLTEHALDIIVLLNRKGVVTYVNPAIERTLGFKVKERIGSGGLELIHPDDLKSVIEKFTRLATDTNAPVVQGETRLRHKDGNWHTFETVGSNLVQNNVVETVIITHRDITERKKTEESLRKSEAKYRLLADHMKDQIWLMDMDLKVTYVSPSVEKLMGYTLDDLKEIPLNKLLTPSSFQEAMLFFSQEMPKALAAPLTYLLKRALEIEFYCKDGQTVWGEIMFSFIRDENGKPVSLLGEGRDISKRKQVEDALRKSEENFRHSLDDSPLGVRISTAMGETIYANRAILDMYGYDSIEELKETPLKDRYTPESCAEFQIRKKKRLQGEFGPSEYEVSIVRKDGEIRHLHVLRKEIFWNGKKQSQVIYQDITLRRQAEKKLNDILENLRQSIKTTIQVLGTASEARDPYTAGHQKRVANLARAIATEMKLPHDKIEAIRMAGAIHDIGKIS
ncbi:MAG: hypothetical protein CVU55_00005, partial [Deltaproteobacteria bacterium HGW-Deltaproteobacteria-13]